MAQALLQTARLACEGSFRQHVARAVAGSWRASPWASEAAAPSGHRTFCTAPDEQAAPTPPTLAQTKSSFARAMAQITRSDPDNAFSIVPAMLDIILDSIPKAVHAVAVTSIEEEALEMSASEQPFAANRKGALPQMDLIISVDPAQILPIMRFLHGHAQLQFKSLVEMTAVDYPERTNARFEVTYVLWSPVLNARLIVKAMVSELTPLDSVTPVYLNADWLERETWDMFGVFFKNHPNLRRLLTDYGFTHHPLRKDFPVQGYTEVFYSEARKAVTTRSIQLAQTQRVVAGQS